MNHIQLLKISYRLALLVSFVLFMNFYFIGSFSNISTLFIELNQQKKLLEISENYASNFESNKEIVTRNSKKYVGDSLFVANSIEGLSKLLETFGLKETYLKLDERIEFRQNENSVVTLTRLSLKTIGGFENCVRYIEEILNLENFYFLDKIMYRNHENNKVEMELHFSILSENENSGEDAQITNDISDIHNPFGDAYEK